MVLLYLWVEGLDDIVQHLATDLLMAVAGSLSARVLISLLEDLKGTKPYTETER